MPYKKSLYFNRPFTIDEYKPSAGSDQLTCSKPKYCRDSIQSFSCRIWAKGSRDRKCGPGYPLRLFRCVVHHVGFTVYPFGWTPYSRSTLIGNDENSSLNAVNDASKKTKWLCFANMRDTPTFKTQKRYIKSWCKLLGIDPDFDQHIQWQTANTLDIDTQIIIDTANKIRAGPTYDSRACGVLGILGCKTKVNLAKILQRGHACHYWGTPIFNDNNRAPHLSRD